MVPSRGLVHPWLSEPVWAPENAWPLRPDNHLRNYEEEDDQTRDRHRDRVSFMHEVISAMQLDAWVNRNKNTSESH